MHDSPEKQTLTQGWLLKDVDYVNFLGMAVWFRKLQYPSSPPHLASLPGSHSFLLRLSLLTFFSLDIFSFFFLIPTSLTPHSSSALPYPPCIFLSLSLTGSASVYVCLSPIPSLFCPCVSLCLFFFCFLVSVHLSMDLSFQPLLYTTPCCPSLFLMPQLLASLLIRNLQESGFWAATQAGPVKSTSALYKSRGSLYLQILGNLLPESQSEK